MGIRTEPWRNVPVLSGKTHGGGEPAVERAFHGKTFGGGKAPLTGERGGEEGGGGEGRGGG